MLKTRTALECRFCSFMQGERGPLEVDAPWMSDEHYAAFVSVGALVPGWTLLLPRDHVLNMSSEYARSSFWQFATRVTEIVQEKYGPVVVFEHGTQFESSITGCGTGHAHMHVVPIGFSLATEALRYDISLAWSQCKAVEIKERIKDSEYLFVADKYHGVETEGLLCKLQKPISQFFRRLIAIRLGLPELYDYKKYQMLDIATATHANLKLPSHEMDGASSL